MKKFLFKLLGTKNYLKLLHKSFHFLYSINALKNNPSYKYHYFDRKIIKKGDIVLDIGANLGYYTKLFAKWTGPSGHVYAVEPVTFFADTLKWGTKSFTNVTVYNYALGEEEKQVTLSTPGNFGYLRTGLPHVVDQNEAAQSYEFTFTAQMKKGSELFANLPRLDFIKCDIEGYEDVVLPELKDVLTRHKPVLQVETWGEQKPRVERFMTSLGYEIYDLKNGSLVAAGQTAIDPEGDLFFIHKDKKEILERIK